jgi:hypothetical protein
MNTGGVNMRFLFLLLLAAGAHGQWLNYQTPGVPRTKDGKPNLSAPAPRAPDGKPDLTGVWMHEITTVEEVKRIFGNRYEVEITLAPPGMEVGTQHKYGFSILADYKPEEAPMQPQAAEMFRQRGRVPTAICTGEVGIPVAGLLSEPIKIVQAPKVTLYLYEVDNLHRQIFTDGRALPKEVNLPAYLGYSVGHWEGDTFVVETAGFNDRTRLDTSGHRHSDALRLTERFRRRDYGHLDIEMTFDDPKMYTKPFTIKVPHDLLADTDLFEMNCKENEKDLEHMRR